VASSMLNQSAKPPLFRATFQSGLRLRRFC
jgi:hypothetical protein